MLIYSRELGISENDWHVFSFRIILIPFGDVILRPLSTNLDILMINDNIKTLVICVRRINYVAIVYAWDMNENLNRIHFVLNKFTQNILIRITGIYDNTLMKSFINNKKYFIHDRVPNLCTLACARDT